MKQLLLFIAIFAISGVAADSAFANDNFYTTQNNILESGYANAQVRWTAAQRNAYNSGHSQGESDRRASRSSSPERMSSSSSSNVRPYYNQGYMDGYNNIPRRYDFALGQNPGWGGGNPGGGWGGGNPGWGSGRESTAYWTGSVDQDANIIIQGSNISVVNVSGSGVTTYQQRMNGSLPRSNTTVNVEKLDGRGNVRVLQQPSRSNNYQAIIRINDSARGADNYRIEVSWTGSSGPGWGGGGGNPGWGSGRESTAFWAGSVDKDANIIIQGGSIRAVNVSGNGVTTYQQSMHGSLPRNNTSVNVEKLGGRGSVRVLQQPSRANNYQAIIRINDSAGGADNYSIEVSWTGGGPGWGGGNPGGGPGWGGGGSNSGSATWSGRVDNTVNIMLRGRSVETVRINGQSPTNVRHNMTSSIPQRQGVTVNVNKRSGRGDVRVLQQPTQYNNYTAIIQIEDRQSGADNYSLDIEWN